MDILALLAELRASKTYISLLPRDMYEYYFPQLYCLDAKYVIRKIAGFNPVYKNWPTKHDFIVTVDETYVRCCNNYPEFGNLISSHIVNDVIYYIQEHGVVSSNGGIFRMNNNKILSGAVDSSGRILLTFIAREKARNYGSVNEIRVYEKFMSAYQYSKIYDYPLEKGVYIIGVRNPNIVYLYDPRSFAIYSMDYHTGTKVLLSHSQNTSYLRFDDVGDRIEFYETDLFRFVDHKVITNNIKFEHDILSVRIFNNHCYVLDINGTIYKSY